MESHAQKKTSYLYLNLLSFFCVHVLLIISTLFVCCFFARPCVYSPGAYINNRSLMPCQEPPIAMSTWQASIHVPEGCVVLMSGNELIGKTAVKDGQGKAKRLLLPLPKGICDVEIQRGIYRPLKVC